MEVIVPPQHDYVPRFVRSSCLEDVFIAARLVPWPDSVEACPRCRFAVIAVLDGYKYLRLTG